MGLNVGCNRQTLESSHTWGLGPIGGKGSLTGRSYRLHVGSYNLLFSFFLGVDGLIFRK